MASRRRIGRRSVIDPGIVLLSASNLLSEIKNLPSSLALRDTGYNYYSYTSSEIKVEKVVLQFCGTAHTEQNHL